MAQKNDHPDQFEPLLPRDSKMEPLLELASDLTRMASVLGGLAGPSGHAGLGPLLRSMNAYYSNRIEGEHVGPADIQRALDGAFSSDAGVARRQRLAIAHIGVEKACGEILGAGGPEQLRPYSTDTLCWIHRQLFDGLAPEDLLLADGRHLQPGILRTRQVAIGQHEGPAHSAVPRFLDRWRSRYAGVRRGEANVVATLAAHHRLAWIHPFEDGNGRVTRFHTQLALQAAGLTHGLWSPSRGFARSQSNYLAVLRAADSPRRGDLDGCGNLTEAGLIDWIRYALEVCIGQAKFMSSMLNASAMQGRIEAALGYEESVRRAGVRREALRPLHYLFSTHGELGRADFKSMTGLGERVATDLLSALLRQGYLSSETPYGKVRFAVPWHALQFYFPDLWPEAQRDHLQPSRKGLP